MKDKSENKLLIFAHLPKTGGGTLRKIINKQYNSEKVFEVKGHNKLEQILAKELTKLRCIQGHVGFGIHHHCSRFYTYITMLREPVDRVISSYYFIRRSPRHGLYNEVKNMNLKEFVSREEFLKNTNLQTFRLTKMERPCSLNHLNKAKENLNKHFAVVGITEMFDESVFLMKKEFGWNDIFYTKRNVTKNRPSKEEVSKEVIDIIKERNKLDIELYEYAKQKLEKRINSLDTESRQELDTFIRENKKNNDVNQ